MLRESEMNLIRLATESDSAFSFQHGGLNMLSGWKT